MRLKPVHAAGGDRLFEFFREFFAEVSNVVCCAAFTAAQVNPASSLYDFEFFVAFFTNLSDHLIS